MRFRVRAIVIEGAAVAIVLGLVTMLAVMVGRAREAAARSSCNLGGVSIAFHNYHDVHGTLPPAVAYSEEGKPLHSWRVLILPYIEQRALYEEFRLGEPWDSEHNLRLLDRMPRAF